jgi:hypothetical protein
MIGRALRYSRQLTKPPMSWHTLHLQDESLEELLSVLAPNTLLSPYLALFLQPYSYIHRCLLNLRLSVNMSSRVTRGRIRPPRRVSPTPRIYKLYYAKLN